MVIKGPSSMDPLQKNKKEEEEMDEDESGSEENEDLGQDALEPGDSEEDDGSDALEEDEDEEGDSAPANRSAKKTPKMIDDQAIEDNSPLGDEDEDEDEDEDDDDDDSEDMEQDARLLLWNLPNDIKQNEIEKLLKQSKLDVEEIRISNAPCAIVKLKNGVSGDFGDLPEKKLRGKPLNLAIFLGEVEPATEAGVTAAAKAGKAAAQQPKAGKQPAAAKTKASTVPPSKQEAEEDEEEEDEEDEDEEEDDDEGEEEEEDGAPTPVSAKNKPKPATAPASKAPTAPQATAGAGGKLTLVVTSIPFETTMEDVKTFMQKHSPTSVFMPTRPDGRHKGLAKLDFETAEAAEAARSVLDGVEFNGRNLRAKMDDKAQGGGGGGGGDRQQQQGNWQQRRQDSPGGAGGRQFADPERGQTRCLLVKGLPVDVRNDTVSQMFGGSQKVERVYTLTSSAREHGNAAAFVTFTTAEGAASAFDDYNGKQIDDCPVPLQIGFAREKGKEEGGGGGFRGGRGGFRGGFRGGDRGGFGGGGRGFGGRGRGGFDRGGFGGGGRGGGRGFRGGGGGRGFGGGRGGGFGGGRGGFKRQSGDMSGSPNQKHLRFNGGGSDSD